MKKISLIIVLTLLSCLALFGGQINGTVTSDNPDLYLGDLFVSLVAFDGTGDLVATTQTDEVGEFVFSNLENGEYGVMLQINPGEFTVATITDETPIVEIFLDVAGIEIPEIEGLISGTIYDNFGNELPNVTVQSHQIQGDMSTVYTTSTNSNGEYIFEELYDGIYEVYAFYGALITQYDGYIDIDIDYGSYEYTDIDIVMGAVIPDEIGVIDGYVVDENRIPIAGVELELINSTQTLFSYVDSDMFGGFMYTSLPYDTYSLNAYIDEELVAEIDGLEITPNSSLIENLQVVVGVELEYNAELIVNIINEDNPVDQGTFVSLYAVDTYFYAEVISVGGVAHFENIPAGDYYLSAQGMMADFYLYEDAQSFEDATILELTDDEVVTITIDLTETLLTTYSVSGIVTDLDEIAIPNAYVLAVALGGDAGYNWNYVDEYYARADVDGNYSLEVPEGEYNVYAYAEGFAPMLVPEILTVTEDVEDFNLVLTQENIQGHSVSGTVTVEGEVPAERVFVMAILADYGYTEYVLANADGTYELILNQSGEYFIMASINGAFPEFFDGEFDWENGETLTVETDLTGIDFDLVNPVNQGVATIDGVVTDIDGNSISNATVLVYDLDNNPIAYSTTNSNGEYAVTFLAETEYNLNITKRSYETYEATVNPGQQTSENAVLNTLEVTPNNNEETTMVNVSMSNYPNPFNPETTISYSLDKNAQVTISVYNVLGQKVKTLVNDNRVSGTHSVVWNGTDSNNNKVSSGIYFYKLTSGTVSDTNKMILMK